MISWSLEAARFGSKVFQQRCWNACCISERKRVFQQRCRNAKFQSDTVIMTCNIVASRLHEICRKKSYRLVNGGTDDTIQNEWARYHEINGHFMGLITISTESLWSESSSYFLVFLQKGLYHNQTCRDTSDTPPPQPWPRYNLVSCAMILRCKKGSHVGWWKNSTPCPEDLTMTQIPYFWPRS